MKKIQKLDAVRGGGFWGRLWNSILGLFNSPFYDEDYGQTEKSVLNQETMQWEEYYRDPGSPVWHKR